MTLHTFKGFVDGARDAYLKAVEKHPQFTDRVFGHSVKIARDVLREVKSMNDKKVKRGEIPTFDNIINEELLKYYEASLLGDTEAAKCELLDCVAVLMREWERISK